MNPPLAVQMFSLRALAGRDPDAALDVVRGLGCEAVELAPAAEAPEELARRLDRYGLHAIAAHFSFQLWDDDPVARIRDLRSLGCRYGVVPSIPQPSRASPAGLVAAAEKMRVWGERCADAGIGLCFHTHPADFAPVDRRTVLDRIFDVTGRALHLELDVAWAAAAGEDPAQLIRQYTGLPLLHVKDASFDQAWGDAPVGTGVVDWSNVVGAAVDAGVRWYIVELDRVGDAAEDLRVSIDAFKRVWTERHAHRH